MHTLNVGDKLSKHDYENFTFHVNSPMRRFFDISLMFIIALLFLKAFYTFVIFSLLGFIAGIYIVKKEYSCLYATANELIEYDQNTGKITNIFPLSSIKEVHLQQKSILSKFLPIGKLVLKTESDTTPLHWHTSRSQYENLTEFLQKVK